MSGADKAAECYDAVVVGLGGMGSAALYHLARRGVRCCGIEQYGIAHSRGSSHGEARIIRKAYFEHPDYLPLLERAYGLWHELEEQSGTRLLVQCGLLLAAPAGSATLEGLERCYRTHDLPHERLQAGEACARYPQFKLDDSQQCFFDPQGGYLHVEACVQQHLALARDAGAVVRLDEPVQGWDSLRGVSRVLTANGVIEAKRIILTAGPWSGQVVRDLGIPLQILRKVQLWYDTPNLADYRLGAFPAYFVETPYGGFYGFPAIGTLGIKVAEHTGGDPVMDPGRLKRDLRPDDETKILRFLSETFPGLQPRRTRHSVCMYTMSPDENFIIDRHPQYEDVVFAAGFSGHGFKFASVVGEILADLATEGTTRHPIGFLRAGRFA
jgi:sarcosine oxidase